MTRNVISPNEDFFLKSNDAEIRRAIGTKNEPLVMRKRSAHWEENPNLSSEDLLCEFLNWQKKLWFKLDDYKNMVKNWNKFQCQTLLEPEEFICLSAACYDLSIYYFSLVN